MDLARAREEARLAAELLRLERKRHDKRRGRHLVMLSSVACSLFNTSTCTIKRARAHTHVSIRMPILAR
eukprot:5696347-Pleurochrysis_carterae.AAC.1